MAKPKFVELFEVNYVYNSFSKRPPIFGWSKTKQFNSLSQVVNEISYLFNPKGYPGDSSYMFMGVRVVYGNTILTFGNVPGHRQDLDSVSDRERSEYYRVKEYTHVRIRYKLLLS